MSLDPKDVVGGSSPQKSWFKEKWLTVAVVGPVTVRLRIVEESVGFANEKVQVASSSDIQISMEGTLLEPDMALLVAEVIRTAVAMAKLRTWRRDTPSHRNVERDGL